MKIIFIFLSVLVYYQAHTQNFNWISLSSGLDGEDGKTIQTDTQGNILVAGFFQGTVDFDPGAGVVNLTSNGLEDIYLKKLNSNGQLIWVKQFGGLASETSFSIALTSNNDVVLAGYFAGTMDADPGANVVSLSPTGSTNSFIVKLDSGGNYLWSKQFGGGSQNAICSITNVKIDPSGNICAFGMFSGTVDFNPGPATQFGASLMFSDLFFLKLNSSGDFIWVKFINGNSFDYSSSLEIDANGSFIATGRFQGTADFNPGVGNNSFSSTFSSFDSYVVKLDSNGDYVWARTFGGVGQCYSNAVKIDPSGNVYTWGSFNGAVDFDPSSSVFSLTSSGQFDAFLQKLDANGNFVNVIKFGSTGEDSGSALEIDNGGNIYASGVFSSTVDFDPGVGVSNFTSSGSNAFLLKLDSNGGYSWNYHISGGPSHISSVKAASNNLIYCTGNFQNTADFNAGGAAINKTALGSLDAFVLGLSQTACSTTFGTDVQSSCTPYTWIDGNTYSQNNNSAQFVLSNAAGCDSVVTLNLTITQCLPFVTRWSTQDMDWDAYYFDGSWIPAAPYIKISTAGSDPYNYNLVWENMDNPGLGDGSVSGLTGPYTITGLNWGDVYQVSISGDFPRFYIAPSPNVFDGQKLLSIEQWGDIVWYNMEEAFSGCINMQYNATDTPNLTNVTNLKDMFSYCSSMTGNNTMNNWNTSAITNMTAMFRECSLFNQPLGNWDVSSVQEMGQMFNNATAFSQPLNSWDVSSVTEMASMFSGASSFNQPLNNWNTSSLMYAASMFSYGSIFNQPINNWDVSNVTTMQFMFAQNTSFNQALNNWDVTSVTNINNMFQNAPAFNQPLNSWNTSNMVSMFNVFQNATSFNQPLNNWNVSNVANLNAMFQNASSFNQNLGAWTLANNANVTFMLNNSGMNCQNYSETLQGWANNPLTPNNRSLGALGRTYGTDAVAARAILTGTKGWTIAGDIAGATNCLSTPPQAQITNLMCSSASHAGNLIENVNANAVSSTVSYTGGNVVAHSGQVVSSTGVTGLTATLSAGTLNNGNGTFTYVITGTPTSSGTANFALNIGGQTCSLQRTVLANPYAPGTVFCNGTPTPVVEVTNPATGRKWMDRNLGANQVSTSSFHLASHGDLYQWGRGADGHQCRNSAVNYTLSSTDQPTHGQFIASQQAPFDWRSPQNDNLWQGVNGANNPCPSGFRIPTEVEFQQEIQTWSSNNAAGAFASPLKWSMAGLRGNVSGTLFNVNQLGHYWSSTVNGTNASYLWFNNTQAQTVSYYRAFGFSIRCIKEVPPPSYGVDVINSCSPFIWIDGNSYTTSNNTATHTLPFGAANGGDSIVTLNLTILPCSQLTPTFCGASNVGWNSDVQAIHVAGAQSYRFRIVGNNIGNTWANNTAIHLSNDRIFRFSEINGTYWGQTYQVDVAVSMNGVDYGPYNTVCSVTLENIPSPSMSTTICSSGAASGGTNVSFTTINGALGYRFRIVGNNTAGWLGNTLEFNSASNSFQFNNIPGMIWGQSYAVSAAILSQDGVTYGNYGPACSLTFSFPTTALLPTSCGITGVGLNTVLRAGGNANATGYLFRITGANSGTPNWIGGSALLPSLNRTMRFADVQGVLPGQTYQIEVAFRAQDGVTYGPFGALCSVTLSNVLMQGLNPDGEINTSLFEVASSHNPFTESFGLQVVTDKIDEWVYITIYDMSGKQIETKQVAPLDIEGVRFGQNLASGMYMIELRQGSNQVVIRQVKN